MNCLIVDDDNVARSVITNFVEKTQFLNLVDSVPNAIEAMNILNHENNIDLLFLDVEMPDMTGIDLISTVKNLPLVIIMSAKSKYALDAFEYDVVDYLKKPYTYARFIKAVTKARDIYNNSQVSEIGEKTFFIKSNSKLLRIKFVDILWVQAVENYVKIYTYKDTFMLHLTMKSIEKKLPKQLFFRVHRSHIINLKKIEEIEDSVIFLKTEKETLQVPVARSYRTKLFERLNLLN